MGNDNEETVRSKKEEGMNTMMNVLSELLGQAVPQNTNWW